MSLNVEQQKQIEPPEKTLARIQNPLRYKLLYLSRMIFQSNNPKKLEIIHTFFIHTCIQTINDNKVIN
jgi:hypothetical protein